MPVFRNFRKFELLLKSHAIASIITGVRHTKSGTGGYNCLQKVTLFEHWQNHKPISVNHRANFVCFLCFAVRELFNFGFKFI
jgi:hypothetical protein